MEEYQEVEAQQEPLEPTGEVETPEIAADEAVESATTDEVTPVETGAKKEPPETVQKRIDELVWQREEKRREAEYWKMQAEKRMREEQTATPPPEPQQFAIFAPRQEDFDTYEAYDEALFDHRYQRRAAQEAQARDKQSRTQAERQQAERLGEWTQKGEDKYPDFRQVAQNDSLAITPFMAGAIQESDVGHDIAYYLGQNPKESARIAKMSPIGQVTEIGKLIIKVQTPSQRTTTKAPSPTSPVGGRETPSKNLEDMSYEEFKAHRNRQLTGGK